MGKPLVVYKCACGYAIEYRAGQHFFYCKRCGRRYQANPRAHPAQYSTRPDPRWRLKFKKYHPPYPNTNTTKPAYYVPQTPPPIMTPAEFFVTNPSPQPLPLPENMPLIPGSAGMPPALPAFSSETAKKTSAGKIIGGLVAAAAIIGAIAILISNNTGECAAAKRALRSWSDCSSSDRSGYNWCYVVNIYGEPGHGYVPKGCVSP